MKSQGYMSKAAGLPGLIWVSEAGMGSRERVVTGGSRVAVVLLAPTGRSHLLEAGFHLLQHPRGVAHHQFHRALGGLQEFHGLFMVFAFHTLQGRPRTDCWPKPLPLPHPTQDTGPVESDMAAGAKSPRPPIPLVDHSTHNLKSACQYSLES